VLEVLERAEKRLADHEYLVGKFYEDYGYYYSASLRYRDLLINYPEQVPQAEVFYRYIKSPLFSLSTPSLRSPTILLRDHSLGIK